MHRAFFPILIAAWGIFTMTQAQAQNSMGRTSPDLLRLEADRLSKDLNNNNVSPQGNTDWKAEMEKMRKDHSNNGAENDKALRQLEKYPALRNMGAGSVGN